MLGEHFAVDGVFYADVDEEQDSYVINRSYANGVPPLTGHFRVSDIRRTSELAASGQTVVVDDARVDIELIRETADRTWTTVERAETALRESELQRIREQSAREEERQRAVREAARSAELAELDRAKTEFFSNVSHEFRTPLTLSLAPLQDALSDHIHPLDPLDPVHRECLELVHRNSLRLLKLVNTLLDFSRIETGRMEAVYEPTNLATYTAELSSVKLEMQMQRKDWDWGWRLPVT